MSVIPFNGRETLYDGSGANKERLKEAPHVGGGLYSTSTCLNECIIRLWFPGLRPTDRKNLLLHCHLLSVCPPPAAWPCHFICCVLFAECMLSICYVNSCYNSWATGIAFYKSRVQREWQRIHFHKKNPQRHTNGLTPRYLHRDELQRDALTWLLKYDWGGYYCCTMIHVSRLF